MIKKYIISFALIFCTSSISSMDNSWQPFPIEQDQSHFLITEIQRFEKQLQNAYSILKAQELDVLPFNILWEIIGSDTNRLNGLKDQYMQCYEHYQQQAYNRNMMTAGYQATGQLPPQFQTLYQIFGTTPLNEPQFAGVLSTPANQKVARNGKQTQRVKFKDQQQIEVRKIAHKLTVQQQQQKEAAQIQAQIQEQKNFKAACTIQSIVRKHAAQKTLQKMLQEKIDADLAQAQAKKSAERKALKKEKSLHEKSKKEENAKIAAALQLAEQAQKEAEERVEREKQAQKAAEAKAANKIKALQAATLQRAEKTQKETTDIAITVDAQAAQSAAKTPSKKKKKPKTINETPSSIDASTDSTNTKQSEIEETISIHQRAYNDYTNWRTYREAEIKKYKSLLARDYDQKHRGEKFNKNERSQTIEKLLQHEINQIDKNTNKFFDEYEAILSKNNVTSDTIAHLTSMYKNLEIYGEVPCWNFAYNPDREARILNAIKTMNYQSIAAKNMIINFHYTHFNTAQLQDPQSCNLRTKGIVSSEALHTSEQEITNLLQLNTESSSDSIASIISNLLEQAKIRPDASNIKNIIDTAPIKIRAIESNKGVDKLLDDMLYAQYAMTSKLLLIPETEDEIADRINIHACVIHAYSKYFKKQQAIDTRTTDSF